MPIIGPSIPTPPGGSQSAMQQMMDKMKELNKPQTAVDKAKVEVMTDAMQLAQAQAKAQGDLAHGDLPAFGKDMKAVAEAQKELSASRLKLEKLEKKAEKKEQAAAASATAE
jgi:hypothetical protein